jgi:regulator of sigma E protease
MPDLVSWILPFLFVLTLVVTVHELGHYWAARAFGTVIECFSIGFGRAIFKWRDKRDVEWRIGWIPLGGYVRFAGDDNAASTVPDDADLEAMKQKILAHNHPSAVEKFYHFKPVWQRAIITAAGPVANFVLAVVLFALLIGIFGERIAVPRVMQIVEGSPAAAAGFRVGDVVQAVDGREIRDMAGLNQYVVVRARVPITFTVDRAGSEITLVATPALTEIVDPTGARQKIGQLGIEGLPTRVTAVTPGSPAEAAGFKAGDVIVKADGDLVRDFGQLSQYVASRAGQPVTFTIDRGEQSLDLVGVPVMRDVVEGETVTRKVSLGLESRSSYGAVERVRYGPIEAIGAGAERTWSVLTTTLYYLGRLVTGQVAPDQIGGVIGIAKASDTVAKMGAEGAPDLVSGLLGSFVALLGLSAILSVSIGFLNLLPIPVLDGGHLLFYAYEAVARRPLAASVQAVGYRLGLALLLGFMLFAVWNDLQRYNVFNFLGGLFS